MPMKVIAAKKEITTSGLTPEQQEAFNPVAEEFWTQVDVEAAKSQEEFEAQLAGAKKEALATWQAELQGQVSKSEFEAEIAKMEQEQRAKFTGEVGTKESEARAKFEAELAEKRSEFLSGLETAKRAGKRQWLATYRRHWTPREMRSWVVEQKTGFESAVAGEREAFESHLGEWKGLESQAFEKGLTSWKEEQLGTWTTQAELLAEGQEQRMKLEMASWEFAEREKWTSKMLSYREQQAKVLEGYKLGEFKETAKPQPTSLSQQILAWTPPDLPEWKIEFPFSIPVKGGAVQIGFDVGKFFEGLAKGGAEAGAGVIASGESLVYGVGGLLGLQTPAPPPTLTASLLRSGVKGLGEATGQWKTSWEYDVGDIFMEQGAPYALGTLLGDVLMFWAGTKVEKAVTTRVIPKVKQVVSPVTQKVSQAWRLSKTGIALEKSKIALRTAMPHWKGSRLESWIIQRGIKPSTETLAIHQQLGKYSARTSIGVPKYTGYAAKATRQMAPSVIDIPELARAHALAQRGVVTGAQLQAEAGAWEMTLFPRATGQLITKGVAPSVLGTAAEIGLTEFAKGAVVGGLKMTDLSKRITSWKVRALAKPPKGFLEPVVGGKQAYTLGGAAMRKQLGLGAGVQWEIGKQLGGAFTKQKWVMPSAGQFHFQKGKLPSLSRLLKEQKGVTSIPRLIEVPAKAIEYLPTVAGVTKISLQIGLKAIPQVLPIMGAGALLGVKTAPRTPVRMKERVIPSLSQAIGLDIGLGVLPEVDLGLGVAQESKLAPQLAPVQELAQVTKEVVTTVPWYEQPTKQPPLRPRKKGEEEPLRKFKLRKFVGEATVYQRYIAKHPIRGVKSASKYIFGKS